MKTEAERGRRGTLVEALKAAPPGALIEVMGDGRVRIVVAPAAGGR